VRSPSHHFCVRLLLAGGIPDVSGVLAPSPPEIIVGNLGPLGCHLAEGREAVLSFRDYAAFRGETR